ncbi:phosphate starvation-inducible protein PhoH [Peptoniphilus asaccharolyticus DSM 20463]|uniref:PhoH-like protein n=1 Tax=Peptoniphilus asaccharolyticus DSM 20463 TaxID=573058 RepID=A0A1W1UU33_PEPAS|nr:PhoH family protein [Peptoniphilus asaccharolyticus]MBL7575187.1 PhoH family protein [Peptoniphilus asaccharolyticus]SMB84602.1 phosphate starvation-inducible protein PhoH [Peptoniphilus asaccharolyticus DSM 20463]
MAELKVDISKLNNELRPILFGKLDEYLITIEKSFDVNIKASDYFLNVTGERAEFAKILLENLVELILRQKSLEKSEFDYALSLVKDGHTESIAELLNETIVYTAMGKPIRAKTLGQKKYLDAIKKNDVCFGIGPAGTGKTYLAMACAVKAFKNQEVSRIILTRPAVEAGESLGFLPGDLQMKVDPYLRPLYDALFEMLGVDNYNKYVEKGMIEVAPLAYMRGRTLDSAFVILDEAQNTTNEQMKMFLTRLGYGSKAIITGDITQTDLPKSKTSGLKVVLNILKNVKGVGITYLTSKDIVRHPLVQRIIEAYDKFEKRK